MQRKTNRSKTIETKTSDKRYNIITNKPITEMWWVFFLCLDTWYNEYCKVVVEKQFTSIIKTKLDSLVCFFT